MPLPLLFAEFCPFLGLPCPFLGLPCPSTSVCFDPPHPIVGLQSKHSSATTGKLRSTTNTQGKFCSVIHLKTTFLGPQRKFRSIYCNQQHISATQGQLRSAAIKHSAQLQIENAVVLMLSKVWVGYTGRTVMNSIANPPTENSVVLL